MPPKKGDIAKPRPRALSFTADTLPHFSGNRMIRMETAKT